MQITYTKESMKITHPTGVVQILSIENLTRLKNRQEQHKEKINNNIALINTDITKIQTAKS